MKYYCTTIYIADGNDKIRRQMVKNFLNALGSGKKSAVRFAVLSRYPNAVDSDGNIISKEYHACVNKYRKPYEKRDRADDDDVLYINWMKENAYDMKCMQMFKHLEDGTSDFLTDLIMEMFAPAFKAPFVIPKLEAAHSASSKKIRPSKTKQNNTEKKVTVIEAPAHYDTDTNEVEDEYYSSAEEMELLNNALAQFDMEIIDKAKKKDNPLNL